MKVKYQKNGLASWLGFLVGVAATFAATYVVLVPTVKVGKTTLNAWSSWTIWGALAPLALALAIAALVWAARANNFVMSIFALLVTFAFGMAFYRWLEHTSLLKGLPWQFAWRGFVASSLMIIALTVNGIYYGRRKITKV